jgi:hypothetical protein
MLRLLRIGGVWLLGIGLAVLVYNAAFLGSGAVGAHAIVQRWLNAVFSFGSSDASQWLIIVAAALVFGTLVSRPLKEGRF